LAKVQKIRIHHKKCALSVILPKVMLVEQKVWRYAIRKIIPFCCLGHKQTQEMDFRVNPLFFFSYYIIISIKDSKWQKTGKSERDSKLLVFFVFFVLGILIQFVESVPPFLTSKGVLEYSSVDFHLESVQIMFSPFLGGKVLKVAVRFIHWNM